MGLFGFGSKEKQPSTLHWIRLNSEEDLTQLIEKESFVKPVVLFKHSIRCSISSMVLNRLESDWDLSEDAVVPVYIDLINYRNISNKIERDLKVTHQSPQILVVKDGVCVYSASHTQINVDDIKQYV